MSDPHPAFLWTTVGGLHVTVYSFDVLVTGERNIVIAIFGGFARALFFEIRLPTARVECRAAGGSGAAVGLSWETSTAATEDDYG